MKRVLIILFSLLLLMSMSSFATNTRVLTMGDNNTILLDEANIWEFPSRINDYPNVTIGEFGRTAYGISSGENFNQFGIHWQFNEENPWMLGTYLYNSDVVMPPSSPLRAYYGAPYGYSTDFIPFDDFTLMSNQRIDLFYGRFLGVNQLPFGFRFSLVHSSQRYDEPTNLDEEGYALYHFASGLTFGGNTDLAVGLQFMTWKDKGTDLSVSPSSSYDESKSKGNYLFYATARHFWQPGSPPWTIIPHAAFYIGKNEAEYYSDPTTLAQTDKYNWFGFEMGSGLQYTPSSDATVMIDFGLRYDKVDGDFTIAAVNVTREATSKTFAIPFFKAGADLKVFDWMDLRLGATSYWDRNTIENDVPGKLIQNYANNATYLGFGFHWGNLHVDTYTDPELFFNGFNFISGETSNMNLQITALYELM